MQTDWMKHCDYANMPKNNLVSLETCKKSYKTKGQEYMKYVQYLLLMCMKSSKISAVCTLFSCH